MATDYYALQAEKASEGYDLSIESCLSEAFNLFRRGSAELIIYGLINSLIQSIPMVTLFLGGPLNAGFYEGARRINGGEETEVRDFFTSFNKFLPMFVIHLVLGLLVGIGFLLLILPGIYFMIVFLFAYQFAYFGDASAGDALRFSRKTVSGNFGKILLLCLVLLGINILGAMAFFVGLLLTIPFTYCVIFVAFNRIIGVK
jgi:hypothetical protein